MTKMFEGKGKTIEDAFMAMLESLKESETLYKVQVHDGDWVIGIKAEKPADWNTSHQWENDRKMFYRKQVEDCSNLKWEDIKEGRHFYCFRDWPDKSFLAGHTYYSGNDSVISNSFGCGELFDPADVPFHFRMATQDEIEQYYIERRERLDKEKAEREEILNRALDSLNEYDDDDDD